MNVSRSHLARLSEHVQAHMGLFFPPERWSDLERAIVAVAREYGYADPQDCIEWLLSAPLTKRQIETLAGHLTVG